MSIQNQKDTRQNYQAEQFCTVEPDNNGTTVEYKDGDTVLFRTDTSIPLRECR
jgi:hypothetical protein